ncbi:MAG: cobalt-zinc-cadmium efflux system protein, partial [Cyclobacteriaceae bacterium]
MGHNHAHDSAKNLKAAFFLNLLFACIELAGGLYTNSVAILSDALHDIGDSLGLGVAWYFDKIAKKKRNKTYSFGYKRFTVIGALINTVVLTIGSIFIISEAIPRLLNPVMPDAQGMIILSIGGLAVNGFAAFRLSHGHSMNEKVAYLHLLEDVLGWAATLAVAITLHFHAIPILDPLLSIVISIFILYNVFKNIKASVTIL